MSWIEKNYKTKAFSKIDDLLSGRKILKTPEGYGKSTLILKRCLSTPVGKPVIFTCHTIENASEKYSYASRWDIHDDVSFHLIDSDSELFRKMIRPQSEELYQLFKKSISYTNHKCLQYQMYSCNNGLLRTVGKSPSVMRQFQSYTREGTPSNINSISLRDIYNSINSVYGKLDYYLIFKINDKHNLGNPLPINVDLQQLLKDCRYDIVAVNEALGEYGISVICITSTAIKNWRGLRKQRDEDLKEILTHPNPVILTQNKVTERIILPELEKKGIESSLIIDEFTTDCFQKVTTNDLERITTIISRCMKYGIDILSHNDIFFLHDLNVYDKIQEICQIGEGTITMDEVNIQVNPEGESIIGIGKVKVAKRLTLCPNTLILTTEKVPSTVMSTFYGYDIYEFLPDYKYKDDNLNFYPTKDADKVCTTRNKKDSVCDFLTMYRELGVIKNETLCIGTSYFGVDLSLEACKGRNFDHDIKRICIVKNPESFNKASTIVELIKQNDPSVAGVKLHEDIRLYSLIDLLNQVLGRISGFRRQHFPTANIDFLFYNRDKVFLKALEKIRYVGNNKLCVNDIYNNLIFNFNTVNINFSRLSRVLNVYNDKDFVRYMYNNPFFNLEDVYKESEYTKRGIINKFVPQIMQTYENKFIILFNNLVRGYAIDSANPITLYNLYELDHLDRKNISFPNVLLLLKHAFWRGYYGEKSYRFKRMSNNMNYLLTTMHKPSNLINKDLINYFITIYKNITWYISYLLDNKQKFGYFMFDKGENILESFSYIERGMRLLNNGITNKSFGDKLTKKMYNDIIHFIRGLKEEFSNPLNLNVITTNDPNLPSGLVNIQLPQAVECEFT